MASASSFCFCSEEDRKRTDFSKNNQKLKNKKLYDTKVVQVADIFTFFKRKYNEATLDRIEEFFPAVVDENKNYDENMVYDFYYKMYNLYKKLKQVWQFSCIFL